MKIKPPSHDGPGGPGQMPAAMAEVTELLTRFGIASQMFQTRMEARLAPYGLTLAQLSVLSHLARRQEAGPQRVTQIARAVEVQQPAVTKMLAKFEGAGWIEQVPDPNDRRARAARITPAGLAHLAGLRGGVYPALGQFLAGWSSEDRQQMTAYLRRLAGFLDGEGGQ